METVRKPISLRPQLNSTLDLAVSRTLEVTRHREAYIDLTVNFVNLSLRHAIPPEFYSRLRLTPKQFRFDKTLEEMQVIETSGHSPVPPPLYMHDGLIEAGIPQKAADAISSSIDPDEPMPMYWDQKDANTPATIYVPKNIFDLSKVYKDGVGLTLLSLGYQTIEHAINSLAMPRPLYRTSWKELASGTVKAFFETVENDKNCYPDFSIEKFNFLKQQINLLLKSETTKLIAKGAEVNVLFDGQDMATRDISFGSDLNQGVLTLAAKHAEQLFTKFLMKDENANSYQERPQQEEKAATILDDLGIDINDPKAIVKHFLASKIPLMYMERRQKRLGKIPIDMLFDAISKPAIQMSVYPD